MIGTTLSHFRITAKLGQGGMGEVYRAEDTKLGREVAIKVLPEAFVAEPDRLDRFQREAKVLASLNHPTIAAIFEVGEAVPEPLEERGEEERISSLHYLVMELVEGRTLAERLEAGPLPVAEVLSVAREIADALEAAHERGVIHRDLKPGNVMLSTGGGVKILDFGLAKVLQVDTVNQAPADLTHSPTLTFQATNPGVLLGTAPYMSPEQVRAEEVDRQTDVWALGCLLFEMLTGRRAFGSDSVPDILASILAREPDLDQLPDATPPAVRRLLRRCLARDKRERIQDMGDVRLALADAIAEPEVQRIGEARTGTFPGSPWLLGGIALVVGLIVGLSAGWLRPGTPMAPDRPRPVVRSSLELPGDTHLTGFASPVLAVSPDGRVVAFVVETPDGRRLFLRHLDREEAIAIEGTATAEGPFFSPDGRHVAWAQGKISAVGSGPGRLMRVSVEGGRPQEVCGVTDYFGGTWGSDGTIYFVDIGGGVLRVPEGGGEPEAVLAPETPLRALVWPEILPGDRTLLAVDWATIPPELVTIDVVEGTVRDLEIEASHARYVPSGHLILSRGGEAELRAVPFDASALEATGSPRTLVDDLAIARNYVGAFAVSTEGHLVFARGYLRHGRELRRIVRIRGDGAIVPVPFDPETFNRGGLSVGPEGDLLVATTWEGGLWAYDLERLARLRLPSGEITRPFDPVVSPDGDRFAFATSWGATSSRLYVQALDGTSEPSLVASVDGEIHPYSWTPDGRIVASGSNAKAEDIVVVATDGAGEPEPLVSTPASDLRGAVSPDGRWLAFESDRSGNHQIYLQAFDGSGGVFPVSVGGGAWPRWSHEGKRILYQAGPDLQEVRAADVSFGPEPRIGRPVLLFRLADIQPWSLRVDPTGDGFFALQNLPDSSRQTRLSLVTGLTTELAQLFPAGGASSRAIQ